MNDMQPQERTAGTLDRRDMLKRSAFVVGAATVWSTPVVQALGTRAAFASTGSLENFVCEEGPDGSPSPYTIKGAVFEWPGPADGTSVNVDGTVNLEVVIRTGQSGNQLTVYFCDVAPLALLRLHADDDALTGRDDLNNEVDFYIDGVLIGGIHTSCSSPFEIGQYTDQRGVGPYLKVTAAEDTGGDVAGVIDPSGVLRPTTVPC